MVAAGATVAVAVVMDAVVVGRAGKAVAMAVEKVVAVMGAPEGVEVERVAVGSEVATGVV